MRTSKLVLLLFGFLSVFQFGHAQYGAQKKGDYYFGQFAYAKAIPEYEKMVEGTLNTDYAHRQLAECYLLTRDFKKAIPHFQMIMHDPALPSDYAFKFAMALYANGQKSEAGKWLKRYKKQNKNDARVKKFLKDGNMASVVFNSRERYSVESAAFNSPQSDFGTYVKDDIIYFASARQKESKGTTYGWNDQPWLDLFMIHQSEPLSEAEKLQGDVNTKFHESSLIFSTDYKNDTIIYFTRNNYFENKENYGSENEINLKIFSAYKDEGKWKVNRSIRINSDFYSTGHPTITADRKRMYYTSDRPGGFGGTDIYYSEIHERGSIGTPINAGPIVNTEGNEMFPFINAEGKLFFSSDGHVGFGQLDIYSTITGDKGQIVDIINLGRPLNSSADDFGYFSNANGMTGYISSNREGGIGSDDIYAFKFTPALDVEGIVTDAINKQPLDSVIVKLFDQNTKTLVMQTMTDKNGYYRMPTNRKTNYRIEASRRTHPTEIIYFNTFETAKDAKMLQKDIILTPVLNLKLLANLNKIYFDFNQSAIRPDAARELDKVVKVMTQTYPDMVIKLEAHTDPIGSTGYNNRLSEARAKSTYDYLIAHGVPLDHIISYKGFGKRMPVNKCTGLDDCTAEELELNRRTEFPIVRIKRGTLALN